MVSIIERNLTSHVLFNMTVLYGPILGFDVALLA